MINLLSGKQKSLFWIMTILIIALAPSCSSEETVPGASTDSKAQDTSVGIDASTKDLSHNDSVQPDIAPDPGTFLAPCFKNEDCDSALCIDSPQGRVCTKTCTETCPTGFDCKEKKDGTGDVIYICAPRYMYLCHPCTSNSGCNDAGGSDNTCVPFGDEGVAGSFCGVKCNPAQPDCPDKFSCQATAVGHQCLPNNMECSCNQKAVDLELETSCTAVKVFGQNNIAKCYGVRKCTPTGLSDCNAQLPEIEKCDDIDNDCNGKTDDLDVSLKIQCSSANKFGVCSGTITSCKNGKPLCDAKTPQPEQCNGLDDDCNDQTDEDLCDDGEPCTQDACKGNTCNHQKANDLPCNDGNVCSKTDVCLQGVCVGNSQVDCDDKDPCSSDSCDALSGCKHKPASDAVCIDDGDVCTQDICSDGKCIHPNAKDGVKCADDGNLCTNDVCQTGKCVNPNADGVTCIDEGNPCTKDICENKTCQHIPDDNKVCKDDGVQCTDDICKNSVCTHPIRTGKCEDGNPCTKNDVCQSGNCIAGVWDECDDGNPCTKGTCEKATGCVQSFHDLMSCTAVSSACSQGVCLSGKCSSKVNVPCSTKVNVNKCGSVDFSGMCTSAGKCTPKGSPKEVVCTKPCAGICFNCSSVEVCWTPQSSQPYL